jgi:hypothetical protein
MSNFAFPPTPPSAVDDGPYQDHFLPIYQNSEFRQHPDSHGGINQQQKRLFNDCRVLNQLSLFRWHQKSQPPTYYGALAPVGLYVLEYGRAAQVGYDHDTSDFLSGNCRSLEHWLVHGTADKLFLLRDTDWFNTRPLRQGSTILHELRSSSTKPLLVEVQELSKQFSTYENCVEPMPIDQIISRFSKQDASIAPINLLSLQCKDDNVVPWPLGKHCRLLNDAATASASASQSTFYASAGKESTEVLSRFVDLQSCMRFQIFGQAGAISSWHMDSIGPYTWVTLEPNQLGKPNDHVLKLWAYVRTDNLPAAEQAEIKAAFARDGGAFQPNPQYIRVISLVAGDTLIMPPGTIHAPITITDCLFRGGMVMQKREMRRSMRAWRFCADNEGCTNENQPRQARAVLDYFGGLVRADPLACGYENGIGVAEFEDDARCIGGESMVCMCKAGCVKGKCGCVRNMQRCGSRCHNGVCKCDNAYGCEAGAS